MSHASALGSFAAPQTSEREKCLVSVFDVPDGASTSIDAIGAALESNRIVRFARCPFPLPDEARLGPLRAELPRRLRQKNISYHPVGGRLFGLDADGELQGCTRELLREHLDNVTCFLRQVVPHLCADWTIGKCSFRPIQERGRNLPAHASNELVHIDAGAYGATHGDRILRFFVNINEREDRVWATKGTLDEVLTRHGAAAGVLDESGRLRMRLEPTLSDRAFSFAVRGLTALSGSARALDTSPYDRAMRRMHNYMKDCEAFKADMHGYEEIRFPPGSAWMVFTDGLSHASLSGQHALVTTLVIRRAALKYPQGAPYHMLASRAARAPASA